jgi:hypothetical protein
MRKVPVFADEYWQLKARRNELRPLCPAEWLAATGYDGSRYDPIFRDGIPADWRGRWRLIREFTERWLGVSTGDVGGQLDAVQAEERRLGEQFPPSLREYIAYAWDVGEVYEAGFRCVLREIYELTPVSGDEALAIMISSDGCYLWAIRYDDLSHDDPPVYAYAPPDDPDVDENDFSRYIRAEARYIQAEAGRELETLSDFLLWNVYAYKNPGGMFRADIPDIRTLLKQLSAAFPVHVVGPAGLTYEGDGIFAHVEPPRRGRDPVLVVSVHSSFKRHQLPRFLRPYALRGGGMFANVEDWAE